MIRLGLRQGETVGPDNPPCRCRRRSTPDAVPPGSAATCFGKAGSNSRSSTTVGSSFFATFLVPYAFTRIG